MEEKRVVITGTGVISPVGNGTEAFWAAIRSGRCGISRYEGLEGSPLAVRVAGAVRDFDPAAYGIPPKELRRNDRFCLFAQAAAAQAMGESALQSGTNIDPERLGVYIGTGIGGMQTFIEQTKVLFEEGADRISPLFIPKMIGNIAAGNIAIRYGAEGASLTTTAACASGTQAIGEAFRAIRYGFADAIIAGGTEATLNPLAFGGFASAHALTLAEDPLLASLPFDRRRAGFVMSEGAAVLVLEEYGHARDRGAAILAEICGYGNYSDAHHVTAPRPDGIGAARPLPGRVPSRGGSVHQRPRNGHATERCHRDGRHQTGAGCRGSGPGLGQLDKIHDGAHDRCGRSGGSPLLRPGPARLRNPADHRPDRSGPGVRPGLYAPAGPEPGHNHCRFEFPGIRRPRCQHCAAPD